MNNEHLMIIPSYNLTERNAFMILGGHVWQQRPKYAPGQR